MDAIFGQSFDTIISIITNVIVFQALLAGLTVSVLLTIPADEFITGDIVFMAHTSRNFRCIFSPSSSYDICSGPGNFSVAACQERGAAHKIGCEDHDIPRMIMVGGCDIANLIESRTIANSVDKAQFLLWLSKTLFAGRKDVNTQYLGGTPVLSADFFPYALADSGLCLPSMQVAWFGFSCIYHTMLTIFVSLFLFLSVSLSRSRENSTERFYWWFPVGIIFILFVFVELFLSAQYFIYYAEYVIAIRFPYLQQSSLWKQMMVKYGYLGSSQDSLWQISFAVCLPLILAHFILVRTIGTLQPLMRRSTGKVDAQEVDIASEFEAFLDRSGLDIETLRSTGSDLLLREEMICAGVTSPKDRLRMIRHIRFRCSLPRIASP